MSAYALFAGCVALLFPIASAVYATTISYILTTKGAIRNWGFGESQIEYTPLCEIGFVETSVSADGVGSLYYKIRFRESFDEGMYTAGLFPEGFIAVSNIEHVESLMRHTMAQI